MRARLLSLALFALASTTTAQTVWVVDAAGGGDFTQIQDAVVAAGEGDTILVRSGTYGPVEVSGKSLVIVEDVGAFAELGLVPFQPPVPLLRITGLQADQSVTVRGLRLRASIAGTPPNLIELESNAGSVWLEDCHVVPTFLFLSLRHGGLSAEDCAGVTLARCTVQGSILGAGSEVPAGISAVNSHLTLYDTVSIGSYGANSTGFPGPQKGGPGFELTGGSLFASGSALQGGNGGGAFLGQDGADGGSGLVLRGGAPVARLLDTTLDGGEGGSPNGPGTSAGADGSPQVVASGTVSVLPGDGRSFETASPVRAGLDPLVETFQGQPGDLALLAYSAAPLPGAFAAGASGDFVLAAPFLVLFKGTLDANGELVTQLPTTAFGPGLDVISVYLQGAVLSATGQVVVLAGPSSLSLIAAGF